MEGGDEAEEIIDVSVPTVFWQDRQVADVAVRGGGRGDGDPHDGAELVVREAPPVPIAGAGAVVVHLVSRQAQRVGGGQLAAGHDVEGAVRGAGEKADERVVVSWLESPRVWWRL